MSSDLQAKFIRHSAHATTICKYWQPNSKWQVPPMMAGAGEARGIMCDSLSTCESCGWNPEVAERRLRELKGGKL